MLDYPDTVQGYILLFAQYRLPKKKKSHPVAVKARQPVSSLSTKCAINFFIIMI